MYRFATIFITIVFVAGLRATAEDWSPIQDVTYPQGNLSFSCTWQGKKGLDLKATPPDGKKELIFRLNPKGAEILTSPKDAFPAAVRDSAQHDLDWLPDVSTNVTVLLKFRQESWVFYINNRLAVILPAPFTPPAKIEISSANPLQETARFQKTMDFTFDDMFLVPEEDDNGLTEWAQDSGVWSLHTAAQTTFERGDIKETASKVPLPERSPNFYSLLGKGTNAVITSGHTFYDSYVLAAAVRIVPGEMGLVFHQSKTLGGYRFTLQMDNDKKDVLCQLWRVNAGDSAKREILGAALLDLTPDQWLRLKVVTYQDRVQCYVDNTEVIDTHVSLPPGGTFGLFATSSAGVQFDDLSARTHHRLDLSLVGGIRRHTIAHHGNFFPRRFFSLLPGLDSDKNLQVGKSSDPQWLILGSSAHKEHIFSADFAAENDDFCIGLIAGHTGESYSHYRFLAERKADKDIFTLEQVSGKSSKQLERIAFDVPAGQPDSRRSISLMFDGSAGKEMRFYRDSRLVMLHHADTPPTGGSGVYVESGTKTTISNLIYDSVRENVYSSRFEKNETFVNDGFMRHWSSPEGEWLPMADKLIWHKSDFFGGFQLKMPFVTGSTIHLGVGEEGTNGVLVVSAIKDQLLLSDDTKVPSAKTALASASIKDIAEEVSRSKERKTKIKSYTIYYEDHWLWVMSGETLLFKHAVSEPFKGTRIRLAGLTTEQLKDSRVVRLGVKDYLFTESPFEWRINGGEWSVVNRFFCSPQWSHMNGESTNGLAALWTKYKYSGDFCMEMYAGMRHTWYERAGDLNLTMMASDTSPSLGYTITCTGWDPDHSQLYTKLYRDGQELAVSDKYLVPRTRVGDVRQGYNPLINSGRGLHGAWYYMKLRRIGNRIEYYFDNELVLSVDDDKPLTDGLAGIWTFMNSMMVARVKIAAERITPQLLKVTPVAAPYTREPSPPALASPANVLKDDVPLITGIPELWTVEDNVGQSRLEWHRESGNRYFSINNTLGSGSMFARCNLPARPYNKLAGWRFDIKRTDTAKVNFHFSVGSIKDKKYTVIKNFFHRLSGTGFSEGLFAKVGETDIPGTAEGSADWHARGDWKQVTVWIPPEILVSHMQYKDNLYIRAEGFGIDQPCYELAGLRGNIPGAGYAVRNFAEIGYQPPALGFIGTTPFSAIKATYAGQSVSLLKLSELQDWAQSISAEGLIAASVAIESSNATDTADLSWINESGPPKLTCDWSTRGPATIEIRKSGEWPNQQLGFAEVQIGDISVPSKAVGLNTLSVMVPREVPFLIEKNPELAVTVTIGDKVQSFTLPWKDRRPEGKPALMNIDGAVGFFESFELQPVGEVSKRTLSVNRASAQEEFKQIRVAKRRGLRRSPWQNSSKANVSIGLRDDDLCNRYMEVSNGGNEARLRTSFDVPNSLANYPLLGFSYQATGMVHISVMPVKNGVIKLSEPYGTVAPCSEPLILDNKWHTWLGDISKVVRHEGGKDDPFQMSNLLFGSMHAKDQTGRFSKWNVDNLILGPAVSTPEQLTFTADYFEFAGIESVRISIREGKESFESLTKEQREKLKWTSHEDKKEIIPSFTGLKDGLCFMYTQARGKNGLDSDVTSIPFLLDRAAPECSFAFEKDRDPACNGTMLKVEFKSRGYHSPINPSQMSLACGDDAATLSVSAPRSRIEQTGDTDYLYLNWPHIFRKQLNASTNGQKLDFAISGIIDGAGNEAPDLSMPYTLDYAKDHRPPTILSITSPSNILWRLNWKTEGDKESPFKPSKQCRAMTVWPEDDEPYVSAKTDDGECTLTMPLGALKWSLTNHPYLSFRMMQESFANSNSPQIELHLTSAKGKVSFLLTHRVKESKAMEIPNPIALSTTQWQTVSLDLAKLVAETEKSRRLKNEAITAITFSVACPDKGMKGDQATLLLQSVTIHSDWSPADIVSIDAYDASGMGGMVIEEEYISEVDSISPLTSRASGPRWISVRVRDKAGNKTRPYHYPVIEPSPDNRPKEKADD